MERGLHALAESVSALIAVRREVPGNDLLIDVIAVRDADDGRRLRGNILVGAAVTERHTSQRYYASYQLVAVRTAGRRRAGTVANFVHHTPAPPWKFSHS